MTDSVFIGAEVIISPLGETAEVNYERLLREESAINRYEKAGWKDSDVFLSKIGSLMPDNRFTFLLKKGLTSISERWDERLLSSPETLVVISSTKGEVAGAIRKPFQEAVHELVAAFSLFNSPLVISNACISGVLAINLASQLIKGGLYRHVVVLGCDVISDFVLFGFQSLYAVSDEPCRPFDIARKGVTLGEGCGGVVISLDKSSFRKPPLVHLGGADANDANHISGPSRTGEGLLRAVNKAVKNAQINTDEIGYLNAHGTGTSFNDEMESIAFGRLSLDEVPLNSLKGYWGHTLGAAGVMETAACMQMLRNGKICASLGYQTQGTSARLNVLTEAQSIKSDIILKTASGFGGGNAALLLKKL